MATPDVKALFQRVRDLNLERDNILNQIKVIQVNCPHSKMPKREPEDIYMDTCPDCEYTQYCY